MTHLEKARKHAKEMLDAAMLDHFATVTRAIGSKTFYVEYIGNDVLEWWTRDECGHEVDSGMDGAVWAEDSLTDFVLLHAYGARKPLTSADVTRITTSDEMEEWL